MASGLRHGSKQARVEWFDWWQRKNAQTTQCDSGQASRSRTVLFVRTGSATYTGGCGEAAGGDCSSCGVEAEVLFGDLWRRRLDAGGHLRDDHVGGAEYGD